MQNRAGGTFRSMLDTMRRLHRDVHIRVYHKKSSYMGACTALPTPVQVPGFAQSDIIKALSMFAACRHASAATHAATKPPLTHIHTCSASRAATPHISLYPHGGDLAWVTYTVLCTLSACCVVTPHGTSSSLPYACCLSS